MRASSNKVLLPIVTAKGDQELLRCFFEQLLVKGESNRCR